MGNGRHLAVFNMTPAQSVSIVDVRSRTFAGEISTPGCAVIMPVANRDFMMICGDGTLQLIRLAGYTPTVSDSFTPITYGSRAASPGARAAREFSPL